MSCVGCGTNGLEKPVYEAGVKALEVFDSYYFDMEISADEAKEKLETLEKRIKSEYDDSSGIIIANKIACISIPIGVDDASALESRNELAEEIGKSKK